MQQPNASQTTAAPRLRFRVPPEPSHLLRARERIRDYLRQYCTDEGLIGDVVLCVEEAATNAIRHSGSDCDIEISLHFADGDLRAEVKDHGRGFDLATFNREALPEVLSEHGRGLFIVAELMDSLELSLDGGLEVRMTRRAERLCEGSLLESAVGTVRAAAELDQRDMRLRALLEEIGEAFIAFDWDYRHIYLNTVAVRMAGKPREEMIGHRPGELWPDYEDSPAGIALHRAMELGQPSIIEHRSLATGNWQETRVYPTPAGVSMYAREINERKRIEQELVATRARLTATLAAITDGFYTLDRRWRVTYLNDKAAAVFPGGLEALGADFWELFPDDVGSSYEASKRGAMDRGEVYSFEFYDPRFDTWFEERDYPGADGITVIFTDVTARKRAEEALRDAEAQAKDLIRYAPTGIYEFKLRGPAFTTVNDAMCVMSGYSREELLAMDPKDLLDAESQAAFAERVEKGLAGEPLPEAVEYRFKTKDGRLRDVVLNSSFTYASGVIDGALVVGYDITERKRAEAALRQSEEASRRAEERYRDLFNTMVEGFCIIEMVFDADGKPVDYRFLEINEVFGEQTGLHDAQGKLMRDLAPDHEQHWFDIYGKVASSGEPARFMAPAAALGRYYDVSAFRVGGPESRQVGILFNDISERHRAEEDRQLLLEESRTQAEELQTQGEELRVQGEELQVRYDAELARRAALLRENELRAGLNAIGELLHSTLEPDEVMSRALSEATRALAIDAAAIEMREGDSWPVRYAEGLPADALGSPLTGEPVIARLIAFSGKPLVLDDAASHETAGPFVARYGIRSLVAVPLVAREEVVAVLLLAERRAVRAFDPPEVDFARRLGTSIGLALDNARLFEAERRAQQQAEEDLETAELLLEAAAATTSWVDLDGMLGALADLLVRSTSHSRVMLQLWHEDRQEVEVAVSRGPQATPRQRFPLDAVSEAGREVIATKKTLVIDYAQTLVPTAHKEYLDQHAFLLMLVAPIVYRERLVGLITVDQPGEARPFSSREIQVVEAIASQTAAALENARLYEAQNAELARTNALKELATAAASSLEPVQLAERVLATARELLGADIGAVYLLEEDGRRALHVAQFGYPPGAAAELNAATVGADTLTGRALLTGELQTAGVSGYSEDTEERAEALGLADHRMIAVPVRSRSAVAGAVALGFRGRRPFDKDDIDLYRAVGEQLGVGLENARLYGEQQRIATTLQENLLHPLPQVPGLKFATRSLPANQAELVGGDFSDVFVTEDGRVAVLIGDVAGKGVRAAGLTETVRSTVRAFSDIDSGPAFILRKVNELLLRHESGEPHVTACLCLVDPATGHVSAASAGHPAPVHLTARSCQLVDLSFGPPLGTFPHDYGASHVVLTLDDHLVLYTDGVTEARRTGELFGEERLFEVIEGLRGSSADAVAQGIADAAVAFGGKLRDDLHIVVVRLA